MSILYWAMIGFFAGVLAKAISPGTKKEPTGCLPTILLGIAGSLVMGFLMELLGFRGQGGLIPTIIGATIGAVGLLYAARKWWK